MPRRLEDIESELSEEKLYAEYWANKHAKHLPKLLDGTDGFERVRLHGKFVRRVIPLWREALNRERNYAEARKFIPLQGEPRGIDIPAAAMSVRVQRALGMLTEEQRELLLKRYVQQKTLVELGAWPGRHASHRARRGRVTKQAVFDRIRRAREAFEQAWLETADLPVTLNEEDF